MISMNSLLRLFLILIPKETIWKYEKAIDREIRNERVYRQMKFEYEEIKKIIDNLKKKSFFLKTKSSRKIILEN